MATDKGITHIALGITKPDQTQKFYETFARMSVIHSRADKNSGKKVLWMSDLTRPFVIVLIEMEKVSFPLGGWGHLGVGCESRAEVDRLLSLAQTENWQTSGPFDAGHPVGYWGIIQGPDGHNLELAYGQEVGLTVLEAQNTG